MTRYLPDIKKGLLAGIPLVFGYLPVALAFGLLAKTVNVSLLDSCLFSLVVFAGASQFMALELVKAGISEWDIILATFLLNLRHLMMSAALAVSLKATKKHWLPFIAFGITDESFAVASLTPGKLSTSFLLALQGIAYTAWCGGTYIGYLLGAALPAAVQSSLGVGLYAIFTAILAPEIKKSVNVLYLVIIAGSIYVLIDRLHLLPAGWNLITTIIIASLAGLIILQDGSKDRQP